MRYLPSWNSLSAHEMPRWLRDAKFGIYTHWGVYSVPGFGPNGTWYPFHMYRPGTPQYEHHTKEYGPPEEFGYREFIPMFTAEHFDAEEWAQIFSDSGARFAGPVAEHHDGFSMWKSDMNEWNAYNMGPKRDVVGELEAAIRKGGMRFVLALHHAEHWYFFNHNSKFDTTDERYSGLYGTPNDVDMEIDLERPKTENWIRQERPDKAFLDQWLTKIREVIDRYEPDLLWFDDGIGYIHEHYRREFLAYYLNRAEAWGREVTVTYKNHWMNPQSVSLILSSDASTSSPTTSGSRTPPSMTAMGGRF